MHAIPSSGHDRLTSVPSGVSCVFFAPKYLAIVNWASPKDALQQPTDLQSISLHSGIVRYDSYVLTSGSDPAGIEPGSSWWEVAALAAATPRLPAQRENGRSIMLASSLSGRALGMLGSLRGRRGFESTKSKYRNRIRLERVSQKQSSDIHKTPYDRVKRCRERKINIKVSERVNVDVFTQNKMESGEIWASINIGVLRADEMITGMKGRGKREIFENTHRPAASSGTIPTCEDLGVNPPVIEPASPMCEAISLDHYTTTACSAGMQGLGKRKIPEKTRLPAASSGTIPTCENSGVTRPGIEPGSPRWKASRLTAQSPWLRVDMKHASGSMVQPTSQTLPYLIPAVSDFPFAGRCSSFIARNSATHSLISSNTAPGPKACRNIYSLLPTIWKVQRTPSRAERTRSIIQRILQINEEITTTRVSRMSRYRD
ncbi:hypothetical protein PR048_017977 [Dryococelus australis]|uniref:Uncharacterized protein n=1 Tax=Dryococelus australis TaxID=614101 RepID=A0ABQ9HBC8_9NEOP|nr:hypothetical protein PR048_017977 [Dryococelus australis]